MAIEIQKDLINQLQISLRKQANVPSYDPNDSSLPSLPSFTNLATDASNSCCLHCKARLLRGPDSLLCAFCGKRQTNSETPPHPIQFKSTSGYRWFLHSLNLDGSEIVGGSLDGNERNRGPGEEFPLSDLLDLEIRWNDAEPEEFESGFRKNNVLKLAGLDVDDDFLAERKGDSVLVSTEGTFSENKGIYSPGSNAFESPGFENFQGSTSTSSGNVSGWQADFQPAASKTDDGAISSLSFAPFVDSSKGNSSHMDRVFEQGKILFDGKEIGNQTSLESKSNDLFQDDMKSISASGDQAQVSDSNAPGKRPTDDDDDSFDAWNDFKGSSIAQDAPLSSSDKTVYSSMHEKGGDSFSGLGAGSDSTIFGTHDELSKSFDQFDLSTHMDSVFGTGKGSFQGKTVDNTTSSHTTNWFQDDLWSNSTSGTFHPAERSGGNVDDKDGGMLGILNNSSVSRNRIHDDQLPLSTNKAAENGVIDEDDDSFGAWNDFKSPSTVNSSIGSLKEPAVHASSAEEKSSDPFSGWDTDFQSANSKNNHEGSKSSDLFVGSSFDLSDHMDKVFASGNHLSDGKAKDVSSNANSCFQDDIWGNSTLKLTRQAENFDTTVDVMDSGKAQGAYKSPSIVEELFPDDQLLTGTNKAPESKTVDNSNTSFDYWSDLKSSTTEQNAFSNSWKQADGPYNQTVVDNNDSSDAWSDFTSSTSAKAPSSVSFIQTVHQEKPSIGTSEIHLFSMDSVSRDNEGCLSQSDFLSGAFSHQNDSTDVMPPKAPLSDRAGAANVRGDDNAEVAKDEDFPGATTVSKTDEIDILMSQMHDLSFMLESNLSIPPSTDGS